MKISVKIARILVAAMFILSAISKMISLPFFDGLVAELLIGEDYYNHPKPLFYTQLLTRFLIAAELVLGLALLLNFKIKQLVLPALMFMLLLFTGHLFYEGFTGGKGFIEGNCGCFGDVLPMNHLESIIKNIVTMLLVAFIWIKYKPNQGMDLPGYGASTVMGAVTLITLLLTVKSYDQQGESLAAADMETSVDSNLVAIDTQASESTVDLELPVTIQDKVDPAKTDTPPKVAVSKTIQMLMDLPALSDGSKLDVMKGKTLLFMFSMSCGHCQEIYKEFCAIKPSSPWPRTAMLNFGKDFEQKYFFNQGGGNHPHILTEDYMKFNRWLEGEGFPRILAISNGKVVKSWNVDTYTKRSLLEHYGVTEVKDDNPLKLQKSTDQLDQTEKKNPWD